MFLYCRMQIYTYTHTHVLRYRHTHIHTHLRYRRIHTHTSLDTEAYMCTHPFIQIQTYTSLHLYLQPHSWWCLHTVPHHTDRNIQCRNLPWAQCTDLYVHLKVESVVAQRRHCATSSSAHEIGSWTVFRGGHAWAVTLNYSTSKVTIFPKYHGNSWKGSLWNFTSCMLDRNWTPDCHQVVAVLWWMALMSPAEAHTGCFRCCL